MSLLLNDIDDEGDIDDVVWTLFTKVIVGLGQVPWNAKRGDTAVIVPCTPTA